MTTLTETQIAILTAAATRPEYIALPLPANIRGGAAKKVVTSMLAKGLIEEVDADTRKGEPIWRKTGFEHGTTLVATDAGLAAIGHNKEAPKPREGTKQATLIAMIRAEGGATINEIVAATGWQPHTVRGAISGALKKKMGLAIEAYKDATGTRRYMIAA